MDVGKCRRSALAKTSKNRVLGMRFPLADFHLQFRFRPLLTYYPDRYDHRQRSQQGLGTE
jgi:hypothetical protein